MEDKLVVGMYVRTKWGIAKIIDFEAQNFLIKLDKKIMYENLPEYYDYTTIGNILKASHNIIDLIEEGDYINGLRVEKSKYGELYTSYTYMGGDIGLQQETYTTFLKDYEKDDVYSILTKEQFESMSYEVE